MAAIVRLMLGEPRWLQGSLGVVFSGVTFCQGAQPHLAALSIPNLLRSSLLTAANSFKGGIRVARACFHVLFPHVPESVMSVIAAFAVPRFHLQSAALRPCPYVKSCFSSLDTSHGLHCPITLMFSGPRLPLNASLESEPLAFEPTCTGPEVVE